MMLIIKAIGGVIISIGILLIAFLVYLFVFDVDKNISKYDYDRFSEISNKYSGSNLLIYPDTIVYLGYFKVNIKDSKCIFKNYTKKTPQQRHESMKVLTEKEPIFITLDSIYYEIANKNRDFKFSSMIVYYNDTFIFRQGKMKGYFNRTPFDEYMHY